MLVRGDAFLVLDFALHIVDRIAGLDLQGDRLSGERLHEDLHASTETEDKVEGGLLLDIVIREGPAILELLAGEDEALLIRRDALLILDLALDVVNGVAGLDLESDGLASEGLEARAMVSDQKWRTDGRRRGHTFTKICMVVDKRYEVGKCFVVVVVGV